MKITRIYSDKNGDSHFEELEIDLIHAGEIGSLSEKFKVSQLQFRKVPADYEKKNVLLYLYIFRNY